jgi:hypothetical protein
MTNKLEKPVCDSCGVEVKQFKQLHKVIKEGKKVYFCRMCYALNRQKHRTETIETQGIKEEIKQMDLAVRKSYYVPTGLPRGRKPREKGVSNYLGTTFIKQPRIALALCKEDKQTLFRKYRSEGMTYEEADSRVTEMNDYLIDLGKTLRQNRKLTTEGADKIFKEEFNKICYS